MSEAVRFYLDEHVGHAIARGLRRRGMDVLTLVEAGMLGADDEDHVAFARIVSQDRLPARKAVENSTKPIGIHEAGP